METIESFFKKESSAGIILIFATLVALLLKNSTLIDQYEAFLHVPIELRIADLHINKPLLLWINDGLMAVFFFLIGLELKREILEGQLSSVSQIALPGFGAIGGMLVPALVYVYFNSASDFAMRGWAIPTATDIAFALGILSLLGNRVPLSLKLFLMALAILDDLGAIIVIALFYTSELSTISISVAVAALAVLITLNYFNVAKRAIYLFVGLVLWVSVLKSGVHATLAGVALAFTIPIKSTRTNGETFSMLKQTESQLHSWVAYLILPLFAFVNAGIDLRGLSMDDLFSNVPLGIFLGLLLGKPLGVFGCAWLAIKFKLARLPQGSNWHQLLAVSILTGIGFTMSLFVNSLAFEDSLAFNFADKLAIILASFISGLLGYLLLKFGGKQSGN